MTKEEDRKLKQVQLELMDEIDMICKNNHICYYIIGGTLIGAIRHKGFIPWDVDIDIAMPRSEYERFKEVCLEQLNNKYQYCDYKNVESYDRPHAIVCVKNTKLISKTDELCPERKNLGIFIDVFPLDRVPDDEKEKQRHIKEINRYRTLRYLRIPYYTSPSALKRFGRRIIKALLSWMSIYKLNDRMDKCMRKYNNTPCEVLSNMAGRYSYEKESSEAVTFGTPIQVEFEGRLYNAPEFYDRYLRHVYGDYMKLPPLEEQTGYLDTYDTIDFGDL